jgi:predicted MFS family arabinose efflux permease
MHVKPRARPLVHRHPLHDFKEGLRYAFGSPPIRTLLLLIAIVSLLGMSQSTLMPIMANRILNGHARTFGMLLCASGCGAFVGSIYLAGRRTVVGLGRVIAVAILLFGLAIIGFSYSTHLWLSLPLLVVMGGMWLVQIASGNTILQTIVDDDKRGRIMSLFAVAFIGMAPFGALLAGRVATHLGAPRTLRLSGLGCLIAGLIYLTRLRALRPLVHGIYIKKGILPEVAAAMQATEPLPSSPPEG